MTTTNTKLWEDCLLALSQEMSAQEFDTWIRPLQFHSHEGKYYLLAPNRFITEKISAEFLDKIKSVLNTDIIVSIGVPASEREKESALEKNLSNGDEKFCSNLNLLFNFDYFVEGKSNQLAKAAAIQVSENFGQVYNPLFLYGSVGLGKTHLMQAVGNAMLKKNPHLKVLYLHSERFVSEMIKALQSNCITQFKNYYRSLDALLIDDIQFFAGKERSQEELFHVFNSLIESGRQMIFTCDRYPKEVHGLEERLKSRFGWGLTVAVEPPELETRVAILLNKASQSHVTLSSEVAFFIAKRVRSNVRELEGALKRVMASASFTGRIIDLNLAKEALRDLIALQERMVTIENIQKIVAEYYKIKISDLLSKRRSRSITRPRQIAMALAKELTTHSLPEIGAAFGGRDHTTVLHATRVIADLKESSSATKEDFLNLLRILST